MGGIAIAVALIACWGVLWLRGKAEHPYFLQMLAIALPAFASGLFEDISKRGGVLIRMASIVLSAILAWCFLGVRVVRVDVPFIDPILAIPAVSFVITVVALAGVTNALNFIDGYNGLSSAVAAIMLAGIGYVAFFAVRPSGVGHGRGRHRRLLGFLFWNWPRG